MTVNVSEAPAISEASSTMRALSSVRCTDVRLYTLHVDTDKDSYQNNERSRELALLNSPLLLMFSVHKLHLGKA